MILNSFRFLTLIVLWQIILETKNTNKAIKTKISTLITTAVVFAVILIAATVSIKPTAALEFNWVLWEVDHPDSQPVYNVNQWKQDQQQQAQQHNITPLYYDSSKQADKITNTPNLKNQQRSQYNINRQMSHFYMTLNFYQSTKTIQSIRTSYI